MKKVILIAAIMLGCASSIVAGNLVTIAESSNYTQTSLYADVMNFLFDAQKSSDLIKIAPFITSTEGRMVPLVILSHDHIYAPGDLRSHRTPTVLIMANIHAGEIEGKEACMMLIRDIAEGKMPGILDHQTILILPIYNADGNEKLGKNRGDNGPELAGMRPNGQNLDLNRDYTKLESIEARGLIDLLKAWDPVLIVDMHTTDGSYHRQPITYTTMSEPNVDKTLRDFMWQKLFPAVSETLKTKYGFDSIPYGNFIDRENPDKGWENDSIEPRYGSNYVGLRNRFTILDENYSHADFKTRVLSSHAFIKSILEYTSVNITTMQNLADASDIETAHHFASQPFAIESKLEKLFDLTIKSYEFKKEIIKPEDKSKYPTWFGDFLIQPTDVTKDYRVPYFGCGVPAKTIALPAGYIVLPFQNAVIDNLKRHGIRVERFQEKCRMTAENFVIETIELEKNIYQGHVLKKLTGHYEKNDTDFPSGCSYIPMNQSLARLIPILLEPQCADSLVAWGAFDRVIVEQWSEKPSLYPVYRISERPPVPMLIEADSHCGQ